MKTMRIGPAALLALLSCIALGEHTTLLVDSLSALRSHTLPESPFPSHKPTLPVPVEGDEVETLKTDSAEKSPLIPWFPPELPHSIWSAHPGHTTPHVPSSHERLSVLQRLHL
jgi:hypothetical protein